MRKPNRSDPGDPCAEPDRDAPQNAMDDREAAPRGLTSFHARRAIAGDAESSSWLYVRLFPLLLADARYRLGGAASRVGPEDLVHDAWAVLIPRLEQLGAPGARAAPRLLRFLSTTLLNLANASIRDHVREASYRRDHAEAAAGAHRETAGIATRLGLEDDRAAVLGALDKLEARERELVVLRGVEGLRYGRIAALLGRNEGALRVEYQRLLARLRRLLPGSVFDELDGE